MPKSRKAILIGSILFAFSVINGCDYGENNSDSDRENKNLTPEQTASTNAPTLQAIRRGILATPYKKPFALTVFIKGLV